MADKAALPLDRSSKAWCLGAAAVCSAPLLLLVPGWLAAALLGCSVLGAAVGWRKRASMILRVLLTVSLLLLVFYAYGGHIGRDTASALLLAMLLLKPIELDSLRDARSLIGFGLFALFAAFLLDQGPMTLGLAVPGAIIAFGVCARLADAEVGSISSGFEWRRVLAILGLFALALPFTLAAFWFFPRLGSPLWGVPEVAKARIGISDNMAPGDMLDILEDDTPAFRVHFDGPVPGQQALYWRGLVLWNFDGRSWNQMDWSGNWRPAQMVPSGRPVVYTLTLEPTDRRYLFPLDLPQGAPDDVRVNEDLTLTTHEPVSSVRAFTLASAVPARFESDLDPGIREVALRLPPGYNPRTLALAKQWRSETTDDVAIIRRALAMYRKDFSYSLAAPPLGRDSVDEFLFDTKIGFCEHFSSSFTFLMRAAGIPARVVTGYVGGYWNRVGNFLLVRQSDAHAWAEVWLPGRGWTRVDPTAAVAPDRVFRHSSKNAAGPGGDEGTIGALFDTSDWLRQSWNKFVLGFDAARQLALMNRFGFRDADSRTLAIAFSVTTAILLIIVAIFQLRDRGPRQDPLLRAWNRFTRRLARARLQKLPHEPAMAWARRIAPLLPVQGAEVLSLSRRFVEARYAPPGPDEASLDALARSLRAFRVQNP